MFSLLSYSQAQSFTLFGVIIGFNVPAFTFIASRLLVPSDTVLETITERFAKLRVPLLVCSAIPKILSPLLLGIVRGDWSIASYLVPVGVFALIGATSANIRLQYAVAIAAAAVYVYGYLNQVRSSRRLERKASRLVCRVFVMLCRKLNLLNDALVAIDGSKFKEVNNRDKNFTRAKMKRRMAEVEASIERSLGELDSSGNKAMDFVFPCVISDTSTASMGRRSSTGHNRSLYQIVCAKIKIQRMQRWRVGDYDADQ